MRERQLLINFPKALLQKTYFVSQKNSMGCIQCQDLWQLVKASSDLHLISNEMKINAQKHYTVFMHFFNISVFHIHNKYIKLFFLLYNTVLNIFTQKYFLRISSIKMSFLNLYFLSWNIWSHFIVFITMPPSKRTVLPLYSYLQMKRVSQTFVW